MNHTVTERCLLPAAPLAELERHVRARQIEDHLPGLQGQWREARAAFRALAEKESGCADNCTVLALPSTMEIQARALLASPLLNRRHEAVPVVLGLVEVEALVASALSLVDQRVSAVTAGLSGRPDEATLAECCWLTEPPHESPGHVLLTDYSLTVTSEAGELELDGVSLADPSLLTSDAMSSTVCAGLSLSLGRAPRTMHGIRYQGRILLVKGHHRARALRALGVTYLPCLVSVCADLDNLAACAPRRVVDTWQRYFADPRPPMLRDFDRRKLPFVYQSQPLRQQLRLQWTVTNEWVR